MKLVSCLFFILSFSLSAQTATLRGQVTDLPPGAYMMQASAPSLVLRQPAKISLKAGVQTLNLLLNIAAEKQEVTVAENGGPTVSTEAASNASAIVLRGTDLDALSDNPDDLMADLQALAGPAAGPNGGSIFIDGFSGGELPPKNNFGAPWATISPTPRVDYQLSANPRPSTPCPDLLLPAQFNRSVPRCGLPTSCNRPLGSNARCH